MYRDFDWARVLDETAVALSLDPNLHLAHTLRARAFYHYGLFRGTAAEAQAAAALAGESSVENQRTLFYAALFGARFPEALRLGEELHQRTDAVAIPHIWRSRPRTWRTRRIALRTARRQGWPDLRAQAVLASMEAAAGQRDVARAIVGRVLAQPYRDHHIAYSLATTHAQLGEMDASHAGSRKRPIRASPAIPGSSGTHCSNRFGEARNSRASNPNCVARSRLVRHAMGRADG